MNKQGTLFYVMGASGAGKDSLLQAIRTLYPKQLLVAHRYITRSSQAGGENHIELSIEEFTQRQQQGLFAMSWQANGFYYALGKEVELWLSLGLDVVVNGSRAYLEQAMMDFGHRVVPIIVDVSAEVLEARLYARGRETPEQIVDRLARAEYYRGQCPNSGFVLDNSGSLQQTIEQFAKEYRQYQDSLQQLSCYSMSRDEDILQ
ncbi:phosphonate metabolism protein/1,5-bisphosphokinase (PRPP-forming) PhnN [Photobacterium gaetbulicola Gung47]|uniref:Ribose 1,5-bisphosphate phosphokinase PhnN n=1 Tax=Photobacterium gaetbulicola Gung47 TaxID=658445 RepID=A0A0C5WEY0_9GAMM|nr:ribose 1,5-bisphosphokinase [Photobacterium gaetbulicola]AJR05693.1 phosphonate metabolism protein/1,5-bisphosphokinase (PRPP-forming) PhnN [Photobacterium gaetbulicola Gung47]